MELRSVKPTRDERAAMKPDELLRTVWLLDDVIESFRWIPVTERLPDPGTQSMLVCLRNGGIFMGISSFLGEFKEISSMGIRSFCMDNQVVAWMQLPEPYQSVF